MNGLVQHWQQTDAVGRTVALLLLLMSISAWVVIVWKAWVHRRALADMEPAVAAFWDAGTLAQGEQRLAALDREKVLLPLVQAVSQPATQGSLDAQGRLESQLTRRLREALHRSLNHLQFGQVLLASIGSTAPFIGLFGTVWGIYHALGSIAVAGSITIDKVAGPVGEALIMTAAGLAVAIPAVLAYNLYGKWVATAEGQLEGFAHDLREFLLEHPQQG